jgi:hypothetical protein
MSGKVLILVMYSYTIITYAHFVRSQATIWICTTEYLLTLVDVKYLEVTTIDPTPGLNC